MTFSRDTITASSFTVVQFTSVCDTCGDYATSWFEAAVDRFEREHQCERRVA